MASLRVSPTFGTLTFLVLLPLSAVGGEKPSRAEIGKRGKAATALVINGASSGSAFCVHPSGLFVTNEHVVRGATNATVKMVVDAALATQRVVNARVLRVDAAQDLALLRADGAKDFPLLPVGNSADVVELVELLAFGFPFGTNLSDNKNEYPSVSVNVCTVSALRYKAGEVNRIDMNGAVNPGQSGGPMLDQYGKVVGVVVSGIRGSGIFQIIPSAFLLRFLEKPEIEFTAPRLDAASASKPATFKARVASLLPTEKPAEVELIVSSDSQASRRQKMEARNGGFEATFIPMQSAQGPGPLDLIARFAGGTVIASSVADRPLKAGSQSVFLKDVRHVRFGASGANVKITRADGTTLDGPLAGLESVEVRIGGQLVKLDLGKAESLDILPPRQPAFLNVTFVVTAGGKEIGRANEVVPILGAGASAMFVFDGKSRIQTPLERTAPVTLEAWFRPNNSPNPQGRRAEPQYLIGSDIPNQYGYGIGIVPQGQEIGGFQLETLSTFYTSNTPFSAAEWSHVAAVFAPTQIVIFLNGKQVYKQNHRLQTVGGTTFAIGKAGRDATLPMFYTGAMREIRISTGERYQKDFTPPAFFQKDETSALIYRASHTSGKVALDLSGNGRDGELDGVTIAVDKSRP